MRYEYLMLTLCSNKPNSYNVIINIIEKESYHAKIQNGVIGIILKLLNWRCTWLLNQIYTPLCSFNVLRDKTPFLKYYHIL